MKRVLTIVIATTILAGVTAAPAYALQSEVEQQQSIRTPRWIDHKREVWLTKVRAQRLRERAEARAAARAAEAAAAEEEAAATTTDYSSYSGGVLSADQVASYARAAGFPESVIGTMVDIAWDESRFDPGAVNGSSGACGLWQMYPCPGSEALNPATNAAMAYYKYTHGGLSHWGR